MRSAVFARGAGLALVLAGAMTVSLDAVPSAPTNLVAQVVGNTVSLTWSPSAAGPVLGYRLEAGSTSGLSNLANGVIGLTPSFTATLVPNGTYFVRVRAIGADGESGPSNEVIVVVGTAAGCTAPPGAPVNLTANVSGLNVTLAWQSGGGCAATNFVVRAGTGPGLSNVAIVNLGPALTLSTAGVPGTFYVRVLAQNGFGTSTPSNEVVVQITGSGTPSPVCSQLTASLASAPFGDPDKAVANVRYPASTTGRAFLNFTSFRRVGASWIEYDWYRADVAFPPGSSGVLIDKPTFQPWRLEYRCDGLLIAQLEGTR